jgi:hypothetical protein
VSQVRDAAAGRCERELAADVEGQRLTYPPSAGARIHPADTCSRRSSGRRPRCMQEEPFLAGPDRPRLGVERGWAESPKATRNHANFHM